MKDYLNEIQRSLKQLSPGKFQKICDLYLNKKYRWNLMPLGSYSGANKTTKGVPDSYAKLDDNTYVLVNYGTLEVSNSKNKIIGDIAKCINEAKTCLDSSKISSIICFYLSSNYTIKNIEDINKKFNEYKVEIISSDTLAMELENFYPNIVKNELSIDISSNQIMDIDDFIKEIEKYQKVDLTTNFVFREDQKNEVISLIENNYIVGITGLSGTGKTKLAIEVCNYYVKNNYKVICMHNKGLMIENDLRISTKEDNTLVFIDDINEFKELENMLIYLQHMQANRDIKMIYTVKKNKSKYVADLIKQNYTNFKEIQLENYTEEQISQILRDDYGIKNKIYLDRINEITYGNSKLATLLVEKAKKGYQELFNIEDIFDPYYKSNFTNEDLGRGPYQNKKLIILFILAILNRCDIQQDEFYKELKEDYLKDEDIDNYLIYLNDIGIIEFYKNTIVSYKDNVIRNYVLYYVLYDRRFISLKVLISKYFVKYKNIIINVLNNILRSFYSKDVQEFIKKEIEQAWLCNKKHIEDDEFINAFSMIIPIKSLTKIKEKVEEIPKEYLDLKKYKVSDLKKNKYKNNEIIEQLSRFQNSNEYGTAFDILLDLYDKKTDLFWEINNCIIESFVFPLDQYEGIRLRSDLINKLWSRCENGVNYNYTYLYLSVTSSVFATNRSFSYVSGNKFVVGNSKPRINDDYEKARINTLKTYEILWNYVEYKKEINDIIQEINYNDFENKDREISLFKNEYTIIYSIVEKEIDKSFIAAHIANHLVEQSNELGIKNNKKLKQPLNNKVYRSYIQINILKNKEFKWRYEDDESFDIVSKEFKDFKRSDYKELFKNCALLQKEGHLSTSDYKIEECIKFIFKFLEYDRDMYKEVIEYYLNSGMYLTTTHYQIIDYLYKNFGYAKTKKIIETSHTKDKNNWLIELWEGIPKEDINKNIVKDVKGFLKEQTKSSNPKLLDTRKLHYYWKNDKSIFKYIYRLLKSNMEMNSKFFGIIGNEDDAQEILDIFKNNLLKLEELYLSSLDKSIDYYGYLFWKIYDLDNDMWTKYFATLGKSKNTIYNKEEIIKKTWCMRACQRMIDEAYITLIDSRERMLFIHNYDLDFIFVNHEKDSKAIVDKKKKWFIRQMKNHNDDKDYIRYVLQTLTSTSNNWTLEVLTILLKENKEYKFFEEIFEYCFPFSESWSGSEIPLIKKKVEFLKNLKNVLGSEYLMHKALIEERIDRLNSYIDKVDKREHNNNLNDYFNYGI